MENTLVLIKPNAVKRKLIGTIIKMYEENGLQIEDMYFTNASKEILAKHYEEHIARDFYPNLVEFMMSGKIVVLNISGEDAVNKVRLINGATNPKKANPCTIRYLYGEDVQKNAVHGSADIKDANRELKIWFENFK